KRPSDPAKERRERRPPPRGGGNVAQHLAQSSDGVAPRKREVVRRRDPEPGAGSHRACELDHRPRCIDAEGIVARAHELAQPEPAAAAEIDDDAGPDPGLPKSAEQAGCGAARELAETRVMNVSQVVAVCGPHRQARRAAASARARFPWRSTAT